MRFASGFATGIVALVSAGVYPFVQPTGNSSAD
jgi:hypothetical protein